MQYDVLVIGGGLSGLTAASLLAKRGLRVGVVEKSYNPGGACGIFKRDHVTFDIGAAMLYGFGEKGFNAHRFVMNCLEEPIDVIKHDLLYCVNFQGHRIKFWPDIDLFTEELAQVFPSQRVQIKRFYRDLHQMYQHVMVENPSYTTADETDPKSSLKSLLKHPISYAKFLSYLNQNAKNLLGKYFDDPEIFKFFDKLTSTYCYTTVEESPAVLAAVMFVDNHVGGSYYPAGSTLFLPGKLEKVIEENGGDMLLEQEVTQILFENGKPAGVALKNGETIYADHLVYSGTVWNLYGKLIDPQFTTPQRRAWAVKQIPTYPSVVLYTYVDRDAIPGGTAPVEMLVGNPDHLDESEVTAYISSIDDLTLCPADGHVVLAIGPTLEQWVVDDEHLYQQKKEKEKIRLLEVLEKRFPGFKEKVRYAEIATPLGIERYTNKNGGAVAGPKQMLGQHMFHRLHTKSEWDTLFCCGESTVMGTGTPTVTTSGLSAANAILKKLGRQPFVFDPKLKNVVRIVEKPFPPERLYQDYPESSRAIMKKASECQFCEHPTCSAKTGLDVRGTMRRVAVGNFVGAKKLVERYCQEIGQDDVTLRGAEIACIQNVKWSTPVAIQAVAEYLIGR